MSLKSELNSRRILFFTALFLICSACSASDDPQALNDAKTQFKEAATYDRYFPTHQNYTASFRHKLIVVNSKIGEDEAYDLALKLRKAYPDTTFDIFDDESKLAEYAAWDEERHSQRRARMEQLKAPAELEKYIGEHRLWSVYNGSVNGENKWSLWDKKNAWARSLE